MDTAERLALDAVVRDLDVSGRSVRRRRVAYYGNVDVTDSILVRVTVLRNREQPHHIGLKFVLERQEDQMMICISEALKALPA
jgi:hypothetical protein